MNQLLLIAHVVFGVLCLLSAVWVFVDALNASERNLGRIRWMSRLGAVFMYIAFVIAGYWYVVYYKADKAIILKGPWPFSHSFFMETKEHLVILLLMLATYLPIATGNNLPADRNARKIVLVSSALVALLTLAMEGEGSMIAMGLKVALLAK